MGRVRDAGGGGSLLKKALAALVGLLLAVLLAELGLRVAQPAILDSIGEQREVGEEHPFHPGRGTFRLDSEIGYVPTPDNPSFDDHGAVANEYPLAKREGWTRLLFLGDSVTRRGKIVEALRERLGDAPNEYWIAALSGYTTYQEVGYYSRIADGIRPDHVILTFHLNDFTTTPTMFLDEDGRLVFFHPKGRREVSPWLLAHSRLYRLYLALSAPGEEGPDNEAAALAEIRESLVRLRDETRADGIELSVIVMPLLAKGDEMAAVNELGARRLETILGLLEELEIRSFDLTAPLAAALDAGVEIQQVPGDVMHPSEDVSRVFAEWLLEQGLF